MKLVSNINLTYSFGDVNGNTEEGIIEGFLTGREQKDLKGNKNFTYSYNTPEGIVIKTGWMKTPVTREEADALYTAVKANLPDINVVGLSAWNDALDMEAFRVKMAETFGITVDKIDIVVE